MKIHSLFIIGLLAPSLLNSCQGKKSPSEPVKDKTESAVYDSTDEVRSLNEQVPIPGILDIDQVYSLWQNTTIGNVKGGDIAELIEAFNQTLPTYGVTTMIKDIYLPEEERHFIVHVNHEVGYASFAEGSDDISSETVRARAWNRDNGHKLFSIGFEQRISDAKAFATFFDYDPAKGTLTPERNYTKGFSPSHETSLIEVIMPEEGDNLEMHEYVMNWWLKLYHFYIWDGMNLNKGPIRIQRFDEMETQYSEAFDGYNDNRFTKYAFIDIDRDGEPELWLSSTDNENQAVFSICEDIITLVAGSNHKRTLCFYSNGAVGDSESCGTGCFHTNITKLENSKPLFYFQHTQSHDMETGKLAHEHTMNGTPISEKEAEDLLLSFGQTIDIQPEWKYF